MADRLEVPEDLRLGSILFTLVEPHPGHEVAYNRWYERDHFYAGCMVGPGILAGERWVATRDLKAMRHTGSGQIEADPMRGAYLALYWIARSQQDEWGTWAAKEVHRLHREGRMFAERDHVHTKMYRYRGGAFSSSVPAELALDHPFAGLVASFYESDDRDDAIAALLERASPGAMTLVFTAVPIPDDAPADVPRIPQDSKRFMTLTFLERAPEDGDVERAGTLWSGPFIPTVPGTDTYTDRLR